MSEKVKKEAPKTAAPAPAQKPEPVQADTVMKGLELLDALYTLGVEKQPIKEELEFFEEEALNLSAMLKLKQSRAESVKALVEELHYVDQVIESYHRKPNYLIQILLEIQSKHHWLPRSDLYWIAKRLEIPMGQILHIATFYKVFSLEPKGKYICRVCLGTACAVRGSQEILDQAERILKIKSGTTTEDGKYTLEAVNCLGCCALGPVMMINDDYIGKLDTSKLKPTFAKYK